MPGFFMVKIQVDGFAIAIFARFGVSGQSHDAEENR